MPELKKRVVAVSFIFKFPDDDDLSKEPVVALFRRSGEVRTYQHKYAPISGSVEETDPSPLATAWREIKEETSLDESSLQLFRQGLPYRFADESIGREWFIHPFGFILRDVPSGRAEDPGIKIDWEHEGWDWFKVDDVLNEDLFEGVPRLLESLRRVWFEIDITGEAGQILSQGLINLQQDHESGARQLAGKALDIFSQVLQNLDRSGSVPKEQWWKKVRFAGWHLWKNGRESMGASILSVVQAVLSVIEKRLKADDENEGRFGTENLLRDLIGQMESLKKEREETGRKISGQLREYLTSKFEDRISKGEAIRILTLSSSSTVSSALIDFMKQEQHVLDLRILESRPLFEGVSMATRIAEATSPKNDLQTSPPISTSASHSPSTSTSTSKRKASSITIYTDASAALAAKDIDILLLGADLIDTHANISNKTGSLPAVLSVKHISPTSKVLVLSDLEKVLPFERPVDEEENDPKEVQAAWPDELSSAVSAGKGKRKGMEEGLDMGLEVKTRNVYFEWVAAELLDGYVTEEGVMSGDEVRQLAERKREKANRYFEGL